MAEVRGGVGRTKAASITPSDDYLDGKGVDANYAAHDWLNASEKRKKNILFPSSSLDEDADDDIYQLTREDESVHEEMWLEIMEIVATFGTIGGGIARRRARRSVLVFARHRVTDTRIFVEEEEGDESEREDERCD